MEVVGSISSLIFLFSLCFATAIEALQTLFHTDHLDTMHHPEWIMGSVGFNILQWIISFFTIGGRVGNGFFWNVSLPYSGRMGKKIEPASVSVKSSI